MDNKKFVLLVSALTVFVCALTIVYNFASMPAYGDTEVSVVPLYATQSSTGSTASKTGGYTISSGSAVQAASSVESSTKTAAQSVPPVAASQITAPAITASSAASEPKAADQSNSSKATGHRTRHKAARRTESAKTATAQNPVNLNTATVTKLETVPYIGEKKAQAIVDYRTAHGPFASVDALDGVKGFGKKTIDKLRPYLTAA